MLVCEDRPRDRVQPRQRLCGKIIQAPPDNKERLTDRALRRLAIRPSKCIRKQGGTALAVQTLEQPPPIVAHIVDMSRSTPIISFRQAADRGDRIQRKPTGETSEVRAPLPT